ncbi:hypothetical protein GGR56DRAFT_652352 [Xylariaceae sp. FL0804]|nr:hypothetical protein GGR56DRAFT_652352 [Xylariaceae sp. FL0804]
MQQASARPGSPASAATPGSPTAEDTNGDHRSTLGLDAAHYDAYHRAILNVLSLDDTFSAMAQLIDGLPLIQVCREAQAWRGRDDTPINQHTRLCDGVVEKTTEYRKSFDPRAITFDDQLLKAYRNALPGSRDFKLRLIELIAVSIHQIAVHLFQQNDRMHQPQGDIDRAVALTEEVHEEEEYRPGKVLEGSAFVLPAFPTLFFHYEYMDHDQYPAGLADVAGYWAEDVIFGGVVQFDRTVADPKNRHVYIHSGRFEPGQRTVRVMRISKKQLDDFVEYLGAEDAHSAVCPLPWRASRENWRTDAWDALAIHHIFRDPWERKLPAEKNYSGIRYNTWDYPETEALHEAVSYGPAYDMEVFRRDPDDPDAPVRVTFTESSADTNTMTNAQAQALRDDACKRYEDGMQPEPVAELIPVMLDELRRLGVTVVEPEPLFEPDDDYSDSEQGPWQDLDKFDSDEGEWYDLKGSAYHV